MICQPTNDVSREAGDALEVFVEALTHWNKKLNLISRNDLLNVRERHVADSAQLISLAPPTARTWIDLGSGAGFPGLICAAIAQARRMSTRFVLVEADRRKAAFLREVARRMRVDADVIAARIEDVAPADHDIVSARALAPLDRLLGLAFRFCGDGTSLLFHKGRDVDSELTAARRHWHIRVVRVPSRTDPAGTLLKLSEVRRRA